MKHNKNLGENRKESQLPIKSRGCNEIQGFRGNCDSKGKLGMCLSLAESDSGGIPRRELLLEKPVFPVRQKGVPPLLLPTSMLQLPRCLVRTYNLDSYYSTLLELESFKKCNCSRNHLLRIQFASQMWATRPHLGSIFVKLLHRKTFQLPAARISPPKQKSRRICCFAYPACFFSVQKLAYSVAFFFFFGITFSVSTPRRFCHQTHRLGTKQME